MKRVTGAGCVAGLALIFVSLGWYEWHEPATIERGALPVADPPTTATDAAHGLGGFPQTLTLHSLGVRAPVVPVVVDRKGALGVPDDPKVLGWWTGGALPGASEGSVVLDGHVDSRTSGAGALFELRHVAVGDIATMGTTAGPVSYRITGVREYDKADLPAKDLFLQSGVARLVLITCGGPFDRRTHHYRDNVVAFGVQVSSVSRG